MSGSVEWPFCGTFRAPACGGLTAVFLELRCCIFEAPVIAQQKVWGSKTQNALDGGEEWE